MKMQLFKSLIATGALALGVAQPATALMIGFTQSGNTLSVVASDLGGDIISAWDFDILYDNTSFALMFAETDDWLGVTNVETIADLVLFPGVIDVFEVSFLSDAELATLQAGLTSFTLLTLTFDQDISNATFSFVWDAFNDVKCEANRVCFPTSGVPEPGSLALLSLGLLGVGFARRRLASRPAA